MVGAVVDAKRMSPPNSFEAAMMLRVVSADVKLNGDAFDEETANARDYFSRATTNSGAHSKARLISESGNTQIALRADSA